MNTTTGTTRWHSYHALTSNPRWGTEVPRIHWIDGGRTRNGSFDTDYWHAKAHCKLAIPMPLVSPFHIMMRIVKPLAEHEPDGQTAIKKGATKGANDLHAEQFNPV